MTGSSGVGWGNYSKDEAVDTGEVGSGGSVEIAEFRAATGNGSALIVTDFEGDEGV